MQQQTIEFYTNFVTNPTLLANGHSIIKSYLLESANNREQTLLNLMISTPPILTLVSNIYAIQVWPVIDEQQKGTTRMFLIETLFKIVNNSNMGVKHKLCKGLMGMIRRIHNQEGYQKWLGLYAEVIKNINAGQFADFIVLVLQGADNRVSTLSINIFSFLFQNLSSTATIPIETLLKILYLCIKSFSHLYHTDSDTIGQHYTPYQSNLTNILWQNMQKSPTCMKYGFKIFTLLYAEMDRFEQVQGKEIGRFMEIGVKVVGEYLRIGGSSVNNGGMGISGGIDDDDQGDQQQNGDGQETKYSLQGQLAMNLPVILYQFLQLFSIIIPAYEEYEQNCNKPKKSKKHKQSPTTLTPTPISTSFNLPLLLCSLLMTTPCHADLQFWIKNTDQYLISIEDQFQKNLRNRATSMIVSLVQDSEHANQYMKEVKEYFGIVGQIVGSSNNSHNNNEEGVKLIEKYVGNKLALSNLSINLPQTLTPYLIQQSCYFVLASIISSLYPESSSSKLPQLLSYLQHRYTSFSAHTSQNSPNSPINLIKILIVFIITNQFPNQTPTKTKSLCQFLLHTISQQKSIYQRQQQQIGLALVLARGLGRICANSKNTTPGKYPIKVGRDIAKQFVQLLIRYLVVDKDGDGQSRKVDEDGTYIVLQLLIKLGECGQDNRNILGSYITGELQVFMLNNYMHDGLLSTLSIKLLQSYPQPYLISALTTILLSGHLASQSISSLIATFIKTHQLTLSTEHIPLILSIYTKNLSIINQIILWYLKAVKTKQIEINTEIAQKLRSKYQQNWLVLMVEIGIIQQDQLQGILCACLKNIAEVYTSQWQIQCKMILPFYIGVHHPSNFIQLLHRSNLYSSFMAKYQGYCKLFQGKNIRLISSLFLIKLCSCDPSLSAMVLSVLEAYGHQQEYSEWQDDGEGVGQGQGEMGGDRNQEENEEDLMERLMGGKMENEAVEKDIQEVFADVLHEGIVQFVKAAAEEMKSKLAQ